MQETDPAERHALERELRLACGAIGVVRNLFVVLAFVQAAAVGIVLFATGGSIPSGLASLFVILPGVFACITAFAAWNVRRNPHLWCLVMTIPYSLFAGLQVLGTLASPTPPALVLSFFWVSSAAGLLWATNKTSGLKDLMAQHPDLRLSRVLTGDAAEVGEGRATRRARARHAGKGNQGRQHVQIWIAGTVATLLVVGAMVTAFLAPEPIGNRAAAFHEAWNDGRLEDVASFLDTEAKRKGLRKIAKGRGWIESGFPPIAESPPIDDSSKRVHIGFTTRSGVLRTGWEIRDGEWMLVSLRFPPR